MPITSLCARHVVACPIHLCMPIMSLYVNDIFVCPWYLCAHHIFVIQLRCRIELNWTELNWTELNWVELSWVELIWLLPKAWSGFVVSFVSSLKGPFRIKSDMVTRWRRATHPSPHYPTRRTRSPQEGYLLNHGRIKPSHHHFTRLLLHKYLLLLLLFLLLLSSSSFFFFLLFLFLVFWRRV